MSKVFVFCVGGTGLRVMKAVTMLLAAGMDAKGYTVVPVLIDPHMDLEEKRNLNTLLEDYGNIYKDTVLGDGKRFAPLKGFFGTAMADIKDLKGQQNNVNQPMAPQQSFSQYLNVGNLGTNDVNNYLVQTLFSEANLNNSLSVGFKGNPNVGTVVLGDMIEGADWFNSFCMACEQGDRVFIISSIFGGTGASGYPLLEKKVRNSSSHPNVQNAIMGAVSVLPYFSLEDPSTTNSDIDAANFLTKTKSALAYYENNVLSDYLYYVGEQGMKTTYKNDERKQDNKAHFIELVAATALFDFLSQSAKPDKPQVLSRAIKDDKPSLSVASLGDAYNDVVRAVAGMTLLLRLARLLPDEKHFPLSKDRGFDAKFYEDKPFQNLCNFLERFGQWYDELAGNSRSFAPLSIASQDDRKAVLSGWIQGISLDAKDESYYLLEMIRASRRDKDRTHTRRFRRFLDYAFQAIDKYISKLV